ncbi:MAG: NAD-dependent epimerase/dehydratase family protein [Prosthecobacter sp.]|nr:NAD-dependent epimerase/dehydratase family protein [Prosthecobacter sp.]
MPPSSIAELESQLSHPTPAVVAMMRRLEGDILILGVAGKMGPSLVGMAKRASDAAGTQRRIIGVSRFRTPEARAELEEHGVETITCDLLDESALKRLPDAPNIVYMAGMKFGSTGQEPLTWAMNAWLPGLVCQKFAQSRIAAFSTGNVYGLVPVTGSGSRETDVPNPAGEYAMSCLGRERIFEHFALAHGTRVSLIRLNYATDLRYGVLVDVAMQVWQGRPVNVRMGWFNTIWQRDANALSLLSLEQAASPAWKVNLAGAAKLSVRAAAERFGQLFGKPVQIEGAEAEDALLSDAGRSFTTLDQLTVSEDQLIDWVAHWISQGGALLGKPTHFESRDGKF